MTTLDISKDHGHLWIETALHSLLLNDDICGIFLNQICRCVNFLIESVEAVSVGECSSFLDKNSDKFIRAAFHQNRHINRRSRLKCVAYTRYRRPFVITFLH